MLTSSVPRPVRSATIGRRVAGVAGVAALLAAVALLGGLALSGVPAAAHGDEGEMTVVVSEQVDGDVVRLEIGLLHADDGHLAEDASVTATLAGPDGSAIGPVALPQISGARYGTDIEGVAPGTWSITIASTDPSTEIITSVEVADDFVAPTTTPAAAPDGEQAGIVPQDPPPAVPTDADDDGFPWVLVVALVVIAVIIVASLTFLGRRRSSA
jgi:hypothetical protein